MAKDITKKSIPELREMLAKERETLRGFRFGEAGSHTRNTRAGRNSRKAIAQILTELNSRNRAEAA